MADVIITAVSRYESHVHALPEVVAAISEHFSYFVKDYKHMPLFKRGIWDGRTTLFPASTQLIPSGLLPELLVYLESLDLSVHVASNTYSERLPFDDELFLTDVATTTDLEIMEHQLHPVQALLESNRSLVLSPTSSGKSLIIYLVARYVERAHNHRTLIIVPNKTLVVQMKEDLCEYANDGWGPGDIHCVYAEQELWTDKRVTVSTYQTATKQGAEWFSQFDCVLIDEAHGATSKSVTHILTQSKNAYYTAGFTGTLDGTHIHAVEMRARFGQVVKVVTTKELMDAGIVAQLHIDAVTFHYGTETAKATAKLNYRQEIDYLITHPGRNEFIVNLAVSDPSKNIMVLFHETSHGHELRRRIKAAMAPSQRLFYVDGVVSIDDRQPIRAEMEARTGCILLASYGTSSVGLSIKNIHWLVLARPWKNRIRVLQTIGRGLRISPSKNSVVVTDIADRLNGERKKTNVTYDHYIDRLEMYSGEGFDYECIDLENCFD